MQLQVGRFVYCERDFESWRFYAYFWLKVWLPLRWNIPGTQEVSIICVDIFLGPHRIFPVFCPSVWPQFRALFVYEITQALGKEMKIWSKVDRALFGWWSRSSRGQGKMDKAKILVCNYMQILLKSGIGFLPNEAKCVWEPTKFITWLGAIFNTSTSEISATVKRITSLQEDLAALFSHFLVLSSSW